MIKNKNLLLNLIVNVISPLLIGVVIYIGENLKILDFFFLDFLQDGIWAYTFTSSILMIWNNEINFFWLSVLSGVFVIFELLQSLNLLDGTGDFIDVFIYFIFGLFSIFVNQIFIKKNE